MITIRHTGISDKPIYPVVFRTADCKAPIRVKGWIDGKVGPPVNEAKELSDALRRLGVKVVDVPAEVMKLLSGSIGEQEGLIRPEEPEPLGWSTFEITVCSKDSTNLYWTPDKQSRILFRQMITSLEAANADSSVTEPIRVTLRRIGG
jgi:hypothetical protein